MRNWFRVHPRNVSPVAPPGIFPIFFFIKFPQKFQPEKTPPEFCLELILDFLLVFLQQYLLRVYQENLKKFLINILQNSLKEFLETFFPGAYLKILMEICKKFFLGIFWKTSRHFFQRLPHEFLLGPLQLSLKCSQKYLSLLRIIQELLKNFPDKIPGLISRNNSRSYLRTLVGRNS